jgi:hypothetical protein
MISGNYLGIYADGCKCDGCGYVNEVRRKELQEKVKKAHEETKMYKEDILKRTSKLKKPFRLIK